MPGNPGRLTAMDSHTDAVRPPLPPLKGGAGGAIDDRGLTRDGPCTGSCGISLRPGNPVDLLPHGGSNGIDPFDSNSIEPGPVGQGG